MRSFFSKESVKQFMLYFCVGGASSVVEWVLFSVFANVLDIQYLIATVIAVICSTTVNWYLGRRFVFAQNKRFADKPAREAAIIFIVGFIGMLFNLVLMYLFVEMFGLNTSVLKTCSKVCATGVVFMYNFLVRKLIIYR